MNVKKFCGFGLASLLMVWLLSVAILKPLVKKQDNGCKVVRSSEYRKSSTLSLEFLDCAFFSQPQPTGDQNKVYRIDDDRSNLSAIAEAPGPNEKEWYQNWPVNLSA